MIGESFGFIDLRSIFKQSKSLYRRYMISIYREKGEEMKGMGRLSKLVMRRFQNMHLPDYGVLRIKRGPKE